MSETFTFIGKRFAQLRIFGIFSVVLNIKTGCGISAHTAGRRADGRPRGGRKSKDIQRGGGRSVFFLRVGAKP